MAIGSGRWGGLRQEPYNPDPKDADNDGIVQEGTPFERPIGTRYLTAAGEEISSLLDGSNVSQLDGLRLVDANGNDVSYNQSWRSESLSLGERQQSIGESLGTVGQSLGTIDKVPATGDYRMEHRPPGLGEGGPLHAMDQIYPADVYSSDAMRLYGSGLREDAAKDREMFEIMRRVRGNPNAEVIMYRAVPVEGVDTINPGDWVTPSRLYAVEHGEGPMRGQYRILEMRVRAGDLHTDGNYIYEFGYDPMPVEKPVDNRRLSPAAKELHEDVIPSWSSGDEAWADFPDLEERGSQVWEAYSNGEIDGIEYEEIYFEVVNEGLQRRLSEISRVYGDETGDILDAWVRGDIGVTEGVRNDISNGRYQGLIELIQDSPPKETLWRGMMIDPETQQRMEAAGVINMPVGATSTNERAAGEYAGLSGGMGGPSSIMIKVEGANAFPARTVSPVDSDDEWLVTGDFDIVSVDEYVGSGRLPGGTRAKQWTVRPRTSPDSDADAPAIRDGSDVIQQRNIEVVNGIKEAGGLFRRGDMTPDERAAFIAGEPTGTSQYRYSTDTPAEQLDALIDRRLSTEFDDKPAGVYNPSLQRQIEKIEQDRIEFIERFGDSDPNNRSTIDQYDKNIERLRAHQDYLSNTPREQIREDILTFLRTAVEDEDTRVAVTVPTGRLDQIISGGGRYKTTHEVVSNHSGSEARRQYEAALGLPMSTPDELRPASGYVLYGDRMRKLNEAAAKRAEELGADMDLFDPLASIPRLEDSIGGTRVYGDIQFILRPEVKDRTKFGIGDSYNNTIDGAPMVGATDDELLGQAFQNMGGKGAQTNKNNKTLAHILDHMLTGRGDMMGAGPEGDKLLPQHAYGKGITTDYHEALIMGSFDLSEVERIVMPVASPEGVSISDVETIKSEPTFMKNVSPEDLAFFERYFSEGSSRAQDEVRSLMLSTELTATLSRTKADKKREEFAEKIRSLAPNIQISWVNTYGVDFDKELQSIADADGVAVEDLLSTNFSKRWPNFIAELRAAEIPLDYAYDFSTTGSVV